MDTVFCWVDSCLPVDVELPDVELPEDELPDDELPDEELLELLEVCAMAGDPAEMVKLESALLFITMVTLRNRMAAPHAIANGFRNFRLIFVIEFWLNNRKSIYGHNSFITN